MKKLGAIAVLLVPLSEASIYCFTDYGSKSRAKIPTQTVTTTIHVTGTVVFTPTTITQTTQTFISLVGKTTITIPIGPAFTPIDSAPRSTTVDPDYYPNSVRCTSTSTITKGKLKTTTLPDNHYIWPQKTLTSTVSTSTFYEACAPYTSSVPSRDSELGENLVYEYRRKPITYWNPNDDDIGPYDPERAYVALSARTCCEWTQKHNYTGFRYEPYTFFGIRQCDSTMGEYYISTYGFGEKVKKSKGGKGVRFGNGPGKGGAVLLVFVP